MTRDNLLLFDVSAGGAVTPAARRRSEPCRQSVIELARDAVRAAALSRTDQVATVDDAWLYIPAWGRESSDLGSMADSIFNAEEWEFTGEWRLSVLKSKKPRRVRVWRLRR